MKRIKFLLMILCLSVIISGCEVLSTAGKFESEHNEEPSKKSTSTSYGSAAEKSDVQAESSFSDSEVVINENSSVIEKVNTSSQTSSSRVTSAIKESNLNSKVDFPNRKIINTAPNISSQSIMQIRAGMTYSDIFKLIGVGANYCDFGMSVYRVDNQKVLVLQFEDKEDICIVSGRELLSKCYQYPVQEPELEARQLYGIVIKEGFAFFPYAALGNEGCYINIKNAEIVDKKGNPRNSSEIKISDKIIVDYRVILSSSPSKIQCTKVQIVE